MRAVRVHTDEGVFCAILGKPGRIYTPFVMIDNPVRKRRMANGDVTSYATDLMLKGKPYPLKRIANHMLRIGRLWKITKGARRLLNEARA